MPCVAADYVSGAREQLAPNYIGEIDGYLKAEYGIITERCSENMFDASIPLEKCEESIADALIELLQSEGLRAHYTEKAKERSKAYDINDIVNKWIEIIEN